jgi:prophage antirepressor-like protein
MEMNDQALKQFDFHGASVRTVMIKGEPWWVAVDVCAVLGLENIKQAIARLEKDGVCQTYLIDSMGRRQKATFINEPGLYELMIRSDKPQSRPFRRWITKEVLPEIRRTGRYSKDVSPWLSTHPSQWHKTLPELLRLAGVNTHGAASAPKHETLRSLGATPIDYRAGSIDHLTRALQPQGVD